MSIGVALFNPFTGKPRSPADIQSDPEGFLLWDGEALLQAAKWVPTKRNPLEEVAQPAQIPEPFGYVVEHNVPPTSIYKWSFHPADQGLSFYKDTALVITPVYTAAAPVNCHPGSPGWPIALRDSTIDAITDGCFQAVGYQGTTALMRAVARAVERQHGIFSGEGQT